MINVKNIVMTLGYFDNGLDNNPIILYTTL
jgi:hypothetical protein